MTDRSTQHSTIVVERLYQAAPERVFAAWADPQARLAWGNPGDGWDIALDRFEWAVGGVEITRFGPHGGPEFLSESVLYDIVENERVVSASTMVSDGNTLFAGLMTVEFKAEGGGCRLTMTEQGVFLDGHDRPENHEAGWNDMLDKLGAFVSPAEDAARRAMQ